MKHKREASLGSGGAVQGSELTAEQLRELFSKLNPRVPLQAYDDLLLQYSPAPLIPKDDVHKHTQTTLARQALKSSRKKEGDEMYELVPSRDLRFLLPGDSLTVFSHKSFPEQFEFTLHYVDKNTGEMKHVVAPHQSRLRAHLSVSRPPGPLRGSVSGPYNQVTFTAATGKNSFSGFSGSFFKKAGILELLPELETVEIPASRTITPDSSPLPSPGSANTLKKRSSAPISPTATSPRNGPSPVGSDEISSKANTFFSSPHLQTAFSTSELDSSNAGAFFSSISTKGTNKVAKRHMPVALSFSTKITSNGVEAVYTSPMFVVCESVDQVDLKVCRVFRHAMLESYPAPPTEATDALPTPRSSAAYSSKKSSRSEHKSDKSDKSGADKSEKKSKRSKSPPSSAAAPAAGKHESTSSTSSNSSNSSDSSNSSTPSVSSGKQESKRTHGHSASAASTTTTTIPAVPMAIQGRCKVEATHEEPSRFQALKFW